MTPGIFTWIFLAALVLASGRIEALAQSISRADITHNPAIAGDVPYFARPRPTATGAARAL